jgi:hypothetical protein
MYYLFESFLVGLYSCIIFFLVLHSKLSFPYLLFVTGFLKHILGNYIGIHSYYCNNGYMCRKENTDSVKKCVKGGCVTIIFESILEGIMFVILGVSFSYIVESKLCNVFFIGVFLHIFCELCGLHSYFCRKRCKICVKPNYNL